jgi:hypothetical protein
MCQRLTSLIIIDKSKNQINIEYYRFMIRKSLTLQLNAVNVNIKKHYAFKGGAYSLLKISDNGKQVYEIDSREGLSLEEIVNCIKN